MTVRHEAFRRRDRAVQDSLKALFNSQYFLETSTSEGTQTITHEDGTVETVTSRTLTVKFHKRLRQSGMEAAILKAAAAGTLIMGICGGFQMLGRTVCDPDYVETGGETQIHGMNLLDMDTVFQGEKVQKQVQGIFESITGELACLNGLRYEGYEIHMGRSDAVLPPLMGNGNVYGSYIHGIFDAPGVADSVLQAICAKNGIDESALKSFDMHDYREKQYDKLADAVRDGLDMEYVYRILNKEV